LSVDEVDGAVEPSLSVAQCDTFMQDLMSGSDG
jgi:hypothetical protein